MKKLMQLLVLVCSLFIMTASAFAMDSLVDNAKLLSAQDKTAVMNTIRQIESAYGVRTAVVTIRDSKISDVGAYANQVLDRNYKDGRNGNMLLLVNMANRKWYISTDRAMSQKINSNYGVPTIGNNVAANLKVSKYKDAFINYAKSAGEQLAYYKQNGKSKMAATTNTTAPAVKKPVPQKEKGSNTPMAAGGGILAGILGALGYGSSLKSSMSNVAAATRADRYMKEGSFNFTERDDTFLYFTYTRVKKAKPQQQNTVREADNRSDAGHGGGGGGF